MRSVTVRLDDLRTMILNLGFVGENEHRKFNFDCKKMFGEYPSASVSLTVQPPAGDCYPATVERNGDLVSWTVTDSDLIEEGCGEVQLTFMVGEVVAKTCIGRTKVERSLGATGDIPTPIENWIEQAEEVISEAEAATAAAEGAAEHQPIIDDNGYWAVWDADAEEYVATEYKAQGTDGHDGVGIVSIEKTGTSGLVDIYTITFTSGNPVTYTVTNGRDADPTEIIDDNAGSGDTDKVWSADKSHELLTEINSKADEPTGTKTAGKVYGLDSNGHPAWVDGGGSVDPAVIAQAVDDWLDEHPEATTTVEDGSITNAKLDSNLQNAIENAYSHDYSVVIEGWTDQSVTYESGYIGSNGSVTANASFRHSNYIPCSEGDKIYYNLYGYSTTVYIVTFYNSSKTRIDGVRGKTGFTEGTVYAPANTAYVIFCSSNTTAYLGTFSQSVLQRVPGDTMASNLKEYTDDKTVVDNTGFKLTRANVPIISGSIYSNQGPGLYTLASGMRTDYIPVSEGDTVKYRCYAYIGSSVKTYTIAMFDSSKTCVDHIKPESSGVISGTYTVASGVAFVMISWQYAMTYDGWFEITEATYTQPLISFIENKEIAEQSPLNGKQWCCLGDSITAGANTTKTYFNFIEDRVGITPWNFGESNTAIAKSSGSVTNNMATRYSSMYDDVDYVTVFGGTNDHGQSIPIGEWGDADQLTLYGAMKILCEGLIAKYIGKKIGFILPLPKYTTTSGGVSTDYSYPNASFGAYIECIHDVCKRYSIPVLNLYLESGLAVANSSVRTALIPDGLHPNADGHEYISRKIQTFLESL